MPDFPLLGSLFTIATIFGLGVLLIDFMGLLGEHGHDDLDSDGGDDGGPADHAPDVADHAEGDGEHDAGHDDGVQHEQADHANVHGDTTGVLILSALRYLRSCVYFSAGFGPVGLLAQAKGYNPMLCLAWSVPSGFVSLVIVRAILRIQRKDTDSTIKAEDILMRKAVVIVPIEKDGMGKVRIVMDQSVQEQYALPYHDDESFSSGDEVYIRNVTDECVQVESKDRFEGDASATLNAL